MIYFPSSLQSTTERSQGRNPRPEVDMETIVREWVKVGQSIGQKQKWVPKRNAASWLAPGFMFSYISCTDQIQLLMNSNTTVGWAPLRHLTIYLCHRCLKTNLMEVILQPRLSLSGVSRWQSRLVTAVPYSGTIHSETYHIIESINHRYTWSVWEGVLKLC